MYTLKNEFEKQTTYAPAWCPIGCKENLFWYIDFYMLYFRDSPK